MMTLPIYGKYKMLQTTNQIYIYSMDWLKGKSEPETMVLLVLPSNIGGFL